MTTPTSTERTISIPVSLATHAVIGCLIALVALAAMFAYFQLPHSHYRGVALTISIIAAAGALSYWLWCATQCLHADVRANAVAIEVASEVATAEGRAAKEAILARSDTATARFDARISALSEEVADNRRAIKGLTEAVNANTAAMVVMTKAFNVLRNCYLQEGLIQQQPTDLDEPRADW